MQKRSHGVAEVLNPHLYMYLSSRTLPANCHVATATIPSILYCTVHSLPTPTGAVLLIIRGQTVSFPVGSSYKTAARKSARRVLGYVREYVHSWPPILSQVSSHRRGSASKRPPRACSTCVPRKANRAWLASHCMSLVAAADSETTHTAE